MKRLMAVGGPRGEGRGRGGPRVEDMGRGGLGATGVRPAATSLRRCLFMCLARWSERVKLCSHSEHLKFFSPVCVRLWRDSSSERANLRWQNWQPKGRSPVWLLSWDLRWEDLK